MTTRPPAFAAMLAVLYGLVSMAAFGVPTVVSGGAAQAASAGACAPGTGVTVVVDFHELGGGVHEVCDPAGGGKSAATIFPEAGFELAYVQRAAGAVCKVAGQPASQACQVMPPSNAYWSLWWAGPDAASWTYATFGVAGLTIPAGGYVAFSWQGTSAQSPPGVAPVHAAAPVVKPTAASSATTGPAPKAKKPTAKPTSAAANPSSRASEGVSIYPAESAPTSASAVASGSPSSAGLSGSAPAASGSLAVASLEATSADTGAPAQASKHGFPAWIAPVIVVVLALVTGTVMLVRRRRA